MENEKDKKTNWPEWIKERIGSGGEAPQKANLTHGRIAWCMAFDRGDQYKILNETTGLVEDVFVSRETRCIYNVCKTFNDAYAAKMWKGNPTPFTAPLSTNTEDYDEDVNVATNGVVEYWCKNEVDFSIKMYDTTRTASVGGIGIAKIYYDKNKRSGIYDGAVTLEKVNPLHFFPNADAMDDEGFREVNHRFPKEKAVAEEEFAEQMKALKITELDAQSKDDAHPEIAAASKKYDDAHNDEVKATVIQNDIWIKACKKYPNGKHVIVIGEHTLVEEDNPEPDKVPFFCYVVNPQDNKLVGLGITYPIIPIQRDMNKSRSVVCENIDNMGHIMWVVKEGSITNPAGVGDLSGQLMEFSGDYAPNQSNVNPLPQHITGQFWELLEMAKFITHIQDLGLGTIPERGSQMASGTAKELVNSESVMFAPDVERMGKFVGKIINRYLFLMKKYCPEQRIVTIIGENKRPEAVSFKGEALEDNYNVTIKVGDGFMRSDEAQVTAITNLMQTPAFQQAGIDSRVVMEELFKKMGLTKLKEDTFKDERQAKRYLGLILSGQMAPYSKFVNANAHIKVFTDFVKQPQYDVLPVEIRAGIDDYINQMVMMTIGQQAPPMTGEPGMPGNEAPVAENPNEVPNVGGRNPIGDTGQAEGMAPLGV